MPSGEGMVRHMIHGEDSGFYSKCNPLEGFKHVSDEI